MHLYLVHPCSKIKRNSITTVLIPCDDSERRLCCALMKEKRGTEGCHIYEQTNTSSVFFLLCFNLMKTHDLSFYLFIYSAL